MVYIPFLSLLGFQATLNPFAPKPKQEPISTDAVPFVNPNLHGGSLLDMTNTGLGEPLNVIISGLSSPWVLADGGFVHFANAVGFGIECFGAHLGAPQAANLGDGHGWVNETLELRQDYGNPDIGTCWESLIGGNHLRLFRQNGPGANTGALFLAYVCQFVLSCPIFNGMESAFPRKRCSLFLLLLDRSRNRFVCLQNVSHGHTITPNGYNIGRDNFVKGALGVRRYQGVKYQTVAQNVTGLLPPGSTGINHGIPTDGMTVLLTVTIIS
ncbi:hypothetical protein EDB83DRAFT_1404655 [Lactarius deliciosus]|nr:hypothetical protein EDB83DRAFT_1404655 [Lactarius deliciosus]